MSRSPVMKLFRFLEILFWILSCLLFAFSVVFILYQLSVLFIPYWWSKITRRNPSIQFPDYFFRVYGDSVTDLNFEHHSYLLTCVAVSAIAGFTVIPNHPWKPLPEYNEKKID